MIIFVYVNILIHINSFRRHRSLAKPNIEEYVSETNENGPTNNKNISYTTDYIQISNEK